MQRLHCSPGTCGGWVALLEGLDGRTPRLAVRVRRASSTPSGAIGSTTSVPRFPVRCVCLTATRGHPLRRRRRALEPLTDDEALAASDRGRNASSHASRDGFGRRVFLRGAGGQSLGARPLAVGRIFAAWSPIGANLRQWRPARVPENTAGAASVLCGTKCFVQVSRTANGQARMMAAALRV
ncbi:hypothetical protein PF003_g15995 [Phytophthora fragariae]|nr:hypothetical protein PF003_g15995 [Phytophthora fragariae]